MAILDELLVGLGYEFDDEDLEKFEQASQGLTKTIAAVSAAAIAATGALTAMVRSSALATDETAKTARQLRVNVEEYDALTFAAEKLVGTSSGVSSALENLSVRASEAAKGVGSGVEAFGMLGVSVVDANGKIKSTDQLLLETSDALNDLEDQGQRLELADKLGLRELDLLLQAGSSEITKLTDEAKLLGVVTEEQTKAAEQFNDSITSITKVATALQREITTGLLPVFQEIADGLTEWFVENRKIIKQNFTTFIKGLTKFLSLFWTTLKGIGTTVSFLIQGIGGFEQALKLVGLAIAGIIGLKFIKFLTTTISLLRKAGLAAVLFQVKLLLIPIALAAIATAIAILIEDIIVFFQGGESAIGKFLEKFPAVEAGLIAIGNLFSGLWQVVKNLGSAIANLFKGNFEQAGEDVKAAFDTFTETAQQWFGFLFEGIKNIGVMLSDSILGAFGSVKQAAIDLFSDIGGFFGERIKEAFSSISNILPDFSNVFNFGSERGETVTENNTVTERGETITQTNTVTEIIETAKPILDTTAKFAESIQPITEATTEIVEVVKPVVEKTSEVVKESSVQNNVIEFIQPVIPQMQEMATAVGQDLSVNPSQLQNISNVNNTDSSNTTTIERVEISVQGDNPTEIANNVLNVISELAENGVNSLSTTVVV